MVMKIEIMKKALLEVANLLEYNIPLGIFTLDEGSFEFRVEIDMEEYQLALKENGDNPMDATEEGSQEYVARAIRESIENKNISEALSSDIYQISMACDGKEVKYDIVCL